MLQLLVCLFIGYSEWMKGNKRARFFSIGWSLNVISVIIFIAVSNGFISFTSFSRNILYVGILGELIVFSVALAERLNLLRNDQVELNSKLEIANVKLRETNASLDMFNYHVSHDLKTVLNNTLGLSRMARKYNVKKDQERVDEVISKLEGVAQNGVDTIHSFLSLGRIDFLLKDENIQWIQLDEGIKETLFQHNLDELIEVEILENQIGQIHMHPKLFESIFLNFFTNTIKYNKNAPKGRIRFMQEEDLFIFEYMDNGIGIDLDKYGEELFKPFHRGAGNKGIEGTGVGLHLVKKIIENFDGTISAESSLGEGLFITIRLPKKNVFH
jgi:signal transduction histidine kinase